MEFFFTNWESIMTVINTLVMTAYGIYKQVKKIKGM